jgi:type I restriction enzyme S subunit
VTNKINKLAELPEGWLWTRLWEISEIVLGQSPSSSTYNENGNGLPFYQGKLEFGNIYPIPQKWCSTPKKIAEKGDVLVSVRAPVGPTNICPEKSCIGRGLAAIRGLGGIETLFILYLMRAFKHSLVGKRTGTTFDAITGDVLKEFVISLPPLPEQHRIVAKIEELFTKLDAGVEALKKVKAQLKRYRQAVLKYAFEGKLTEEWRKNLGANLVIVQNTGQEKALPLQKDLPELPEGWVWTRVGHTSDSIHYGYTVSASEENIGPKLLRITDIQNNSVNWDAVPYCKIDESKKQKYLLKDGDLVFARTGATVEKSFLIVGNVPESVFASYLIRIILNNSVNKKFIYSFFQSTDYWRQISKGKLGIGQPNVNAQTLSQITIPLPPLPEQHKVVEEIERHFSVADEVEKVVEESLKQAERLRQSILKKAFEGKLVPQDPTDEPTDKLLERIKAERTLLEKNKKNRIRQRNLKDIEYDKP